VTDAADLGLFPLGMVLLPGERVPLHLFEPRYRALAADCILEDRAFVLVQGGAEGVSRVGCSARFESLLRRFSDGRMNVTVMGVEPVELIEATGGHLYPSAQVRPLEDDGAVPDDALVAEVVGLFRTLSEQVAGGARDPEVPEGVALSYAVAGALEMAPELKQTLLDSRSEPTRLAAVRQVLDDAREGVDRSKVAAERAQNNGKVIAP